MHQQVGGSSLDRAMMSFYFEQTPFEFSFFRNLFTLSMKPSIKRLIVTPKTIIKQQIRSVSLLKRFLAYTYFLVTYRTCQSSSVNKPKASAAQSYHWLYFPLLILNWGGGRLPCFAGFFMRLRNNYDWTLFVMSSMTYIPGPARYKSSVVTNKPWLLISGIYSTIEKN